MQSDIDMSELAAEPNLLLPLESTLGFRLSRLARAMRKQWADELDTYSLSPPQAAILRAVALQPGCAVREVARALASDAMNVKRCVDELESQNLLKSESRPGDKRARALYLTPSGSDIAKDVDRLARVQEAQLHSVISPDEESYLARILDHLEELLALGTSGDLKA